MHAMTMMERVRIVWMQGAGVAREQGGYRARADLHKLNLTSYHIPLFSIPAPFPSNPSRSSPLSIETVLACRSCYSA